MEVKDPVMRLVITLLALCALAVGGAGCSSGSQAVESGHWKIDLPAGWEKATPLGQPWTAAYIKDGVTLQVAGQFSEDVTARAGLARLELTGSTKLKDYETAPAPDITIKGAYDAAERRYSYTDGDTRTEGVWIVASQYPYPQTAALSLTGKRVDQALVDELVSHVTFVEKH